MARHKFGSSIDPHSCNNATGIHRMKYATIQSIKMEFVKMKKLWDYFVWFREYTFIKNRVFKNINIFNVMSPKCRLSLPFGNSLFNTLLTIITLNMLNLIKIFK